MVVNGCLFLTIENVDVLKCRFLYGPFEIGNNGLH